MNACPQTLTSQVPDEISDRDFAEIVRIALETSGISIDESKRPMIYSRFARRLRDLNLDSFEAYIDLLKRGDAREHTAFINTVTTNLTYFFREPHHFDYLSKSALPALMQRNRASRTLRAWSSACSSGQEVYSIAIAMAEFGQLDSWDTRLLATDIDTDMVAASRSGLYADESLRGLSSERRDRWMERCSDGRWQVVEALRSKVICKQLNLFASWPFRSGVDLIFCRNALIYFDEEHQHRLLQKFADFQTPGAFLVLGHSESIKGTNLPYKRVANTVFERI